MVWLAGVSRCARIQRAGLKQTGNTGEELARCGVVNRIGLFFIAMAQIERKSFSTFDVKADDQQGVIEAIVAVFNNRDRGDDIIRPGAFKESLQRKLPKGVWHHNWAEPVARTLEARELMPGDALLPESLRSLGGLYIKAQFNLSTQRGREAYSDVQFGIIDEFSIGYRATKKQFNDEDDSRELIECELYEWSPVLVGMNPATALLSVKGDSPAGLPLAAHSEGVLACLSEFTERIKSLSELRAKEGRAISTANRQRLESCCAQMRETMTAMQGAHDELSSLAAMANPKKDAASADDPKPEPGLQATAINEYAKFLRASARV